MNNDGTGEDNSSVGRVYAHAKADVAPGRQPGVPAGMVGRGLGGAAVGALVGFGLGIAFVPGLTSAFLVGGAMTGAAVRIGTIIFGDAAAHRQSLALQQELHELKQQEFALRHEAARLEGSLRTTDAAEQAKKDEQI